MASIPLSKWTFERDSNADFTILWDSIRFSKLRICLKYKNTWLRGETRCTYRTSAWESPSSLEVTAPFAQCISFEALNGTTFNYRETYIYSLFYTCAIASTPCPCVLSYYLKVLIFNDFTLIAEFRSNRERIKCKLNLCQIVSAETIENPSVMQKAVNCLIIGRTIQVNLAQFGQFYRSLVIFFT